MRLSTSDRIRETKLGCNMKSVARQMALKWISLSFSFSSSLLPPPSWVNVTSPDAFHSPLAVPARRYSVKAIYIRKWHFLAFPSHSPLPHSLPPSLSTSFRNHLQLFIFLTECIWAWMKAYINQPGHLSTYLREKRRFITSYLEWLGGK